MSAGIAVAAGTPVASVPSLPPVAVRTDAEVVAGLRAGDRNVFDVLVTRYHTSFVHVAQSIVRDRCIAEDVAQEAWLAVLKAIDGFEQRSSLQTWLYRIVVNIARGRSRLERRTVTFTGLAQDFDEDGGEVPDREILPRNNWAWRAVSERCDEDPEVCAERREVRTALAAAMRRLPPRQCAVLQLRDVEGIPSEEVATLLGISCGNQRVLLHRARRKMREALLDQISTGALSRSSAGTGTAWDFVAAAATTAPIPSQMATR